MPYLRFCPDAVEVLAAEKQGEGVHYHFLPVFEVRRPMRVLCWKIAYAER